MSPSFEERLTEFLLQARSGDKRALEDLITDLRQPVLALAERLLQKSGAKLDAEDIAHSVLVEVWNRFDSFKGQTTSELFAWMHALVRHEVPHSSRRRETRSQVYRDREVTRDTSSPEQQIMHAEQSARLQRAMQQLSERQRAVVALQIEGLTLAQVAERLGITKREASRTSAVAIRRLRDMMEGPALASPRPPRSESARPQSPLVSERTTSRALSANSPEDEAYESVRRLYLRLGLIHSDASSSCEIDWGEFERLLFGPGDPDSLGAFNLLQDLQGKVHYARQESGLRVLGKKALFRAAPGPVSRLVEVRPPIPRSAYAVNEAGDFVAYLETLACIHLDPRLHGKFGLSDVVQETLVEAWQDAERFRALDPEGRKRWLRRMLVNNLLDTIARWRAGCRDVRLEQPIDAAAADSSCRLQAWLAAEDSSPSERLGREEEALRLLEALSRLDGRQREALILQKYHGWTLAQIAEHLGCTAGAVAVLHARGLKKLRQHLAEEQ